MDAFSKSEYSRILAEFRLLIPVTQRVVVTNKIVERLATTIGFSQSGFKAPHLKDVDAPDLDVWKVDLHIDDLPFKDLS